MLNRPTDRQHKTAGFLFTKFELPIASLANVIYFLSCGEQRETDRDEIRRHIRG